MSPERSGTTDHDIVHHFVMARWHMMGGAIRCTRVPQDVGNFPRRSAWVLPLRHWGTAGGVRKHDVTPSGGTEYHQSTADRTDCAPWLGAAG